jgi:hypothetical protein
VSASLPLLRLDRAQWRRLLDFAALVALICFLLAIGIESYAVHGVDFRGYYAAARVVLAGGNPYDYRVLSQVLLDVTGQMGNNPYYYPPWLSVALIPLAWLPFQAARLVWAFLLLGAYWSGASLTFDVLEWKLGGWRRWLVMLSGAYLFVWISVRSEQLGTWLFLFVVLSLWGYKHDRAWLAGAGLALLLTKPNVTWLVVPALAWHYAVHRRRIIWWTLGILAGLLIISTWIVPGWYTHLGDAGFGAGLQYELDGPDQVRSVRLYTVLHDWLAQWGIAGGAFTVTWCVLAVGCGAALWWAWRRGVAVTFWAALASAFGLLLTPYALQYDYPPLILGVFWLYQALCRERGYLRWVAWALLAFVASVPLWEHPVYDGYWMALGMASLLLLLNHRLWHRPAGGLAG